MKRHRLHPLTNLAIAVSLLVNACTVATPATTPVPTITPIPPTITPTMEPTMVSGTYKNDEFGVSFNYPSDWNMLESADNPVIVIGNGELSLEALYNAVDRGEARIIISIASLERQAYGNPIATLEQYTLFSDLEMPDKEPAHIVEINDREFAIGTYSESYIKSRQSEIPLFIAMHFTRFNTITVEMYGTPAEEAELRTRFEDFIGSIDGIQSTRFFSHIPFDPTVLISSDDLDGWTEPNNGQRVLRDGICRRLENRSTDLSILINCTFIGWEYSNMNEIIEQYQSESDGMFFELETKYDYPYEVTVYGYRTSFGQPAYLLKLDNTDVLTDGHPTYIMLELAYPVFENDTNFENNLRKQFSEEIDSFLYDVMNKMLEKVK